MLFLFEKCIVIKCSFSDLFMILGMFIIFLVDIV